MERKQMPTIPLINEVRRIIAGGQKVMLPVNGVSMLPFIVGGRDSVELCAVGTDELRIGDVLLAMTDRGCYVVHRLVAIDGDRLTLEGDGNLNLREVCASADVVARAEWVSDNGGHRRRLRGRRAMMEWRMWAALRPLRRWLLMAYRLLHGGSVGR